MSGSCRWVRARAHGSSDEGYSLILIVILILILIPHPSPIRLGDGSLLMHTIRGCAADQSDQHGDISNEDFFSRFSLRKSLLGHKQDYDYDYDYESTTLIRTAMRPRSPQTSGFEPKSGR